MSKHTPGPWMVWQDTEEGMSWNRCVMSGEENRVCFMTHSNGAFPEIDEANARLIAAAPDLYEALKLCVDILNSAGLSSHTSVAIEAIAKAEGKE